MAPNPTNKRIASTARIKGVFDFFAGTGAGEEGVNTGGAGGVAGGGSWADTPGGNCAEVEWDKGADTSGAGGADGVAPGTFVWRASLDPVSSGGLALTMVA